MRGLLSQVKGAGLLDTRENCWDFFINKSRTNLHMVFTCSPVGEQFRVRAQRFLAMINSTVIDWFQPWPERALSGVSQKFMDEVDLDSDEIKQFVVDFMPLSFSQARPALRRRQRASLAARAKEGRDSNRKNRERIWTRAQHACGL